MSAPAQDLDVIRMHDPYTLYTRLRRERPVSRVRLPIGAQCWLITRYHDVRAALVHPDLTKDGRARIAMPGGGSMPLMPAPVVSHLLNLDPPDHTRLRSLVASAFTGRANARWQASVTRSVTDRIAALAGADTVDLLAAFALPLTREVVCDVIGVAPADRDAFVGWAKAAMLGNSAQAVADCTALIGRYRDALPSDPAGCGDGLIPQLLSAAEDREQITDGELVSMVFLLLIAGWETTAAAIVNSVLTLLLHPSQLAAVRADLARLDEVVEELLRYESPVNLATMRITTAEVELGGVVIPAGQLVMVALGAANRDGDRFAAGDGLDIDADPSGHVAFGYGIHRCLGAPLGRLITRSAVGALLAAFPRLELAVAPEELRWQPLLLRGPEELPVRPGPPA